MNCGKFGCRHEAIGRFVYEIGRREGGFVAVAGPWACRVHGATNEKPPPTAEDRRLFDRMLGRDITGMVIACGFATLSEEEGRRLDGDGCEVYAVLEERTRRDAQGITIDVVSERDYAAMTEGARVYACTGTPNGAQRVCRCSGGPSCRCVPRTRAFLRSTCVKCQASVRYVGNPIHEAGPTL